MTLLYNADMSDKTTQFPAQTANLERANTSSFGKNMHDIFRIIGTTGDFSEYSKPVIQKRQFKDEKGTFSEMDKTKKKGTIIVKE